MLTNAGRNSGELWAMMEISLVNIAHYLVNLIAQCWTEIG